MRLTNINEKESEHEEIRPYWGTGPESTLIYYKIRTLIDMILA